MNLARSCSDECENLSSHHGQRHYIRCVALAVENGDASGSAATTVPTSHRSLGVSPPTNNSVRKPIRPARVKSEVVRANQRSSLG